VNKFLALLRKTRAAHAAPLSWDQYLAGLDRKKRRVLKLDLRRLPRDGKHCVICSDAFPKPRSNKRYCDKECKVVADTASTWAGLRFVAWLRDSGECVSCGAWTKTAWRGRHFVSWKGTVGKGRRIRKDSWAFRVATLLGVLDSKLPKSLTGKYEKDARSAEIDHIKPIFRGGDPFDLLNLQTLCGGCHRGKTSKDLTGPKRKKQLAAKKVEFRPGSYADLDAWFGSVNLK